MSKRFDEMAVIENSIIPIYEKNCIDGSNLHEQVINARELFSFLRGEDTETKFADWIRERIEKYGFIENQDYCSFSLKNEKPQGGRPTTEYLLTLDVAKEIAMVENNDKGRMIRRYFIEAEKRYRETKLTRARAKAERRLFTDIIRDLVPESIKNHAYKNFTDLVYKHVTGYNAKQLRELYEKPKNYNVRDLLTPQQLKEVLKYESIIQGLLQLGQDYSDVKAILDNPAAYLPGK